MDDWECGRCEWWNDHELVMSCGLKTYGIAASTCVSTVSRRSDFLNLHISRFNMSPFLASQQSSLWTIIALLCHQLGSSLGFVICIEKLPGLRQSAILKVFRCCTMLTVGGVCPGREPSTDSLIGTPPFCLILSTGAHLNNKTNNPAQTSNVSMMKQLS